MSTEHHAFYKRGIKTIKSENTFYLYSDQRNKKVFFKPNTVESCKCCDV